MKHVWLLVLAGCVPLNASPTGQVAAAGATCAQVFECYGGCGEDAGCYDACFARADAGTQAAVNALTTCTTERCNSDGACVQTTCAAEVAACRGGSTANVAAEDPRQPHPTAGILAWMVGDWIGSNHQFQFWEGGAVRRSSGAGYLKRNGEYGCVYTINETGTVTQEGDVLVMVFPETAANNCGDREVSAGLTVRYRIEWFDSPYPEVPGVLELHLRDLDCTNGDMWCVENMRRRK